MNNSCIHDRIGKYFLFGVILLTMSIMVSCGKNENQPDVRRGVYLMEMSNVEDDFSIPRVTVGENNSFHILTDLKSSYFISGHYTLDGDILIASTEDGVYQYRFRIKDGELIYIEANSDQLFYCSDGNNDKVKDGANFIWQSD